MWFRAQFPADLYKVTKMGVTVRVRVRIRVSVRIRVRVQGGPRYEYGSSIRSGRHGLMYIYIIP